MTWAVIVSAVGVGMSAVSSYQQAQSARAQAQYQQQVAYNNSIIAQQNAADVRDRGDRDAEEHRDRIAQSKGAAKGDMASLGFLIDDPESTNVGLLADIAGAGELDILKMQDNTRREERRALIQGDQFVAQAGLYGLQASAQNPGAAAAGTLLSGATSVYKSGKGTHWK
tara:strand:- start:1337 stop:1843 length:507 start_codon:yes stop_codon:yes gene_type:complete